jgi:hypothetical protein
MQVDDRVTLDDYRVAAWVEILDADMTLDFAIGAVRNHYASETAVLMPAHVNRAWRAVKSREKELRHTRQITGAPKAIPSADTMRQLDDLRARFAALADKAHPDKAQDKEHGGRPKDPSLSEGARA